MPFNDYQGLLDQVESLKKDFEKFYLKGNKSSGTKIRLGLQILKKKIQEIREEIQTIKKDPNTQKYIKRYPKKIKTSDTE